MAAPHRALGGLLILAACRRDKEPPVDRDTWDTGDVVATDWVAPACDAISGAPALAFSVDGGSTVVPPESLPETGAVSWALAALSTAGKLAFLHEGALYRSADAGCTWTATALPGEDARQLSAGPDDALYAWSDERDVLYQIADAGVTALTPPPEMVGLIVDPGDAAHLRAADSGGTLWESTDGGASWAELQRAPSKSLRVNSASFDPEDLDHVVCALSNDDPFVSFNAGERWDRAKGVTTESDVNSFVVLIPPGDREVVWVQGVRLVDGVRVIWRSADGGLTFTSNVEEDAEITLSNGVPMSVARTAPNELVFGGDDTLYTWSARSGEMTSITPIAGYPIGAVLASEARGVYYLGLSNVVEAR